MPLQLKLSTRAHHKYPAYAKAFRITCALSKASETIQPATQHMGITSNPKGLTKKQQNTQIRRPINQSLLHARKKRRDWSPRTGWLTLQRTGPERIFIFCPDFDPSNGLLDWIFTVFKIYYRRMDSLIGFSPFWSHFVWPHCFSTGFHPFS